MEMTAQEIKEIKRELNGTGSEEISREVILYTKEKLLEEYWVHDLDEEEREEFTSSPFYVHAYERDPIGYGSVEEALSSWEKDIEWMVSNEA